jgi:exodeoxyribonuclease VII small subunit
MTDEEQKQPDLKEQMSALSDIVEKLEDPDVSLEASLALYEQGMALVKRATATLELAEQRVAVLTADGDLEALDP